MKTRRSIPIIVTLVTALMLSSSFGDQPHMKDALEHLRAARHALEVAEKNKAGHRLEAIKWIDRAIAEVEAGIQSGR